MPILFKSAVNSLKINWKLNFKHHLLFFAILGIGIFARTWEYRSLPPGLNQDEAENGVEAQSLLKYGVDRNGVSFPVRFISWGSGQDALYGYMLIPFVALGGLTTTTVRFPMLIIGILTIVLTYLVGNKIRDKTFGLIVMFLISISPWHIMYSRWGLEVTLLPFFFLLGLLYLFQSEYNNYWFILACLFFSMCLYAYITSYLAIPLFLILSIPVLRRAKRISLRSLIMGLTLLTILAMPLILWVIINSFDLESIRLGVMTIPHLPSPPRHETDIAIFQTNTLHALSANLLEMAKVLILQNDGFLINSTKFGYLYVLTFPFIILGAYFFLTSPQKLTETKLVLMWLISALVIGIFVEATFNRLNLAFIPLFIFCAAFIDWLNKKNKIAFIFSIALFLAGFLSFTYYYHNSDYKNQADRWYFTGLLSALNYAKDSNSGAICVTTNKINMPYIFVLFSEKMDSSVGPNKVLYIDSQSQFRSAKSVGRYMFGLENCPVNFKTTYVLFFTESLPIASNKFKVRSFGLYTVYTPK